MAKIDSNGVVINANSGGIKKIVVTLAVILALLIVILNSFTTVSAGHTGVVTTFGKVSEGVLSEGLHFKIPFIQNIILIDNRVQKAEASCSSASKDLQTVSSTIAVNYKVLNGSSASVYKNIGMDYESVIIIPSKPLAVSTSSLLPVRIRLYLSRDTCTSFVRPSGKDII